MNLIFDKNNNDAFNIEHHYNYIQEHEKKVIRSISFLLVIAIIEFYFIFFFPFVHNEQSKYLENLDDKVYYFTKKAKQLSNIYAEISDPQKQFIGEINNLFTSLSKQKNKNYYDRDLKELFDAIKSLSSLTQEPSRYSLPSPFFDEYEKNIEDYRKQNFIEQNIQEKLKRFINENHPIYDLGKLATLDSIILRIYNLQKKESHNSEYISGLLDNFATYTHIQTYTPLDNQTVEYFSDYSKIVRFINPPFNVKTLNDLLVFWDYLLANYSNENTRDNDKLEVGTPYFQTSIELFVIIILIPLFITMIAYYLTKHLNKVIQIQEKIIAINKESYIYYRNFSQGIFFYLYAENISIKKVIKTGLERLTKIFFCILLFSSQIVLIYRLFGKIFSEEVSYLFYGIYLEKIEITFLGILLLIITSFGIIFILKSLKMFDKIFKKYKEV